MWTNGRFACSIPTPHSLSQTMKGVLALDLKYFCFYFSADIQFWAYVAYIYSAGLGDRSMDGNQIYRWYWWRTDENITMCSFVGLMMIWFGDDGQRRQWWRHLHRSFLIRQMYGFVSCGRLRPAFCRRLAHPKWMTSFCLLLGALHTHTHTHQIIIQWGNGRVCVLCVW